MFVVNILNTRSLSPELLTLLQHSSENQTVMVCLFGSVIPCLISGLLSTAGVFAFVVHVPPASFCRWHTITKKYKHIHTLSCAWHKKSWWHTYYKDLHYFKQNTYLQTLNLFKTGTFLGNKLVMMWKVDLEYYGNDLVLVRCLPDARSASDTLIERNF